MRRQRFDVLSLAGKAERLSTRSHLHKSRFRQWTRAFGKPQSIALSFGAGLLVGLRTFSGQKAPGGRLLRWTNTLLLFRRLAARASAAQVPATHFEQSNEAQTGTLFRAADPDAAQ
jgi:hypothetical protein